MDGRKNFIIRSPMQLVNNLQIPIEIILSNEEEKRPIIQEERTKHPDTYHSHQMQYELVIKPEQSFNIPLRACGFN